MSIPKSPFALLLLTLLLALQACSSGSSSDVALPDPPPVANNQPPVLSGIPPDTAVQDRVYSFIPTATDPESDPLIFTIENLPGWATFDTGTGELSGSPTVQHLGSYTGISISVSDGKDETTLGPFDIEVVPTATGSLTLSWKPPTQSADGSQLTDLAGYRIRWGTQSGNYPNLDQVDNPGLSRLVIDGLAPGTYFFVVSAIDSSNNESAASNEADGIVQ